jgi:hypothetical protein
MKGLSIALFSLMLAALTSTCAYADSTFDFTFSGGAVSASGQFTAIPTGVGTYLITGVSGTTNGVTITGILPPKNFAGNDNVLEEPGPVLNSFGVSYSLANGEEINLYIYQNIDNATIDNPSAGTLVTTAGTLQITSASAGPATQFTMKLSQGTIQLQSKQHTTVSLALSSVSGFTDVMSLGCLGLPFAATCTFSNNQPTLAANGTQTVQIVIDTGSPLTAGGQASATRVIPNHGEPSSSALLCFMPLGAVFGLLLFRTRSRKQLGGLLLLLFFTGMTLGLSGCEVLNTNGTPPGTYTFKVTASGAKTGVTQSQSIVLTVTQ